MTVKMYKKRIPFQLILYHRTQNTSIVTSDNKCIPFITNIDSVGNDIVVKIWRKDMERKVFKMLTAVVLAVFMVVGMVPFGVFAGAVTWTADTSWYTGDTATEYVITTAGQLVDFSQRVDDGNTFEGKTVKLGADIDLELLDENGDAVSFNPIGSYRNGKAFKGTFDGQNHTIKNLSQNTWALDTGYYYGDLGLGLFGLVEDAEIKNLKMDGAGISGESAICGTVAACAYGDCTFDNITISNSNVADYQYYAGGIVGWASGEHTYSNCNVESTTTVGSQWGDFGNANGGLIGGIGSSAVILFKDCVVACRIDATNDVVSAYQWYNYRNSGMLIGKVPQTITEGEAQTVATPENVTCDNVTVIFDDWANYTYCEFAGTGYPYVRVQSGTSVDAYSNVRYGHPTDANGKTVVDDNHVHNEGEDHHVLIEFKYLYGGPANHRYCYYGIEEYPGVSVYKISTAAGMKSDETGHWYECLCKGIDKSTNKPICTDKALYEVHSTDDGFVTEEGAANHWKVCKVCDKKYANEAHTESDWIVDVEATEYNEGARHKECEVCGQNLDLENLNRLMPEYMKWLPSFLLTNTQYKITAEAGEGGFITPEGTTKVYFGMDITYSITPMEGYAVKAVYIDGRNKGALDEYTFSQVLTEHSIRVEFEPIDDGE